MRRIWPIGIITAALLAGGVAVSAHEECDEPEANDHADSHPAQSRGPQLPPAIRSIETVRKC